MKDKPPIEAVEELVPGASDLQEIGAGGFKVVYKALVKGHIEAVKLVRIPRDEKDETVEEENRRRIEREIHILDDCKTPFLVKLGGLSPRPCTIGKETYVLYSEEYLPGQSLRELLESSYKPTGPELAAVGICLLKAVGELSRKGVVHRDIKPDNVIKTGLMDRPYVLLDLGIAFRVGGTPLTRDAGRVPGTLYYIAPEMLDVEFRQNLDHRADLYTIGLTLYEFASGVNPFRTPGDQPYTTLYRIKTVTPSPIQEHRPDLPSAFCNLIDQLLKKLPALRPSSIASLVKSLEAFQ